MCPKTAIMVKRNKNITEFCTSSIIFTNLHYYKIVKSVRILNIFKK